MISSRAPSQGVPWAHSSKQKRTESGTNPESWPISNVSTRTGAPATCSDTVVMTLSVIDSS